MRTFIKALFVVLGMMGIVIFVLPLVMFGILNAGNIIGIGGSVLILGYGIFFHKANKGICRMWKRKTGKVILGFIAVAAFVGIGFVAFATTQMVIASNDRPSGETTVIVLGCQVRKDGPSRMLQERLIAAQKFLEENPQTKCILSGGKGNDEPMSEAECMYNWLVTQGIDKNRLYIEDKSTSTRENLIFSKKLIEREGLCSKVTIITNDFHQYRADKIALANGIKSYNVSGKTQWILLPTYYVRELGGILFEIFAK